MITLIVTYVVSPGHEDELEGYARALIPATRAEPGCRTYDVNRGAEDDRTIVFYERYDDEEALAAHRATPHYKANVENGLQKIAERRFAEMYVPFE